MVMESIKQAIEGALTKLGIKNPDVSLEHPAELSHGDYSTNAALRYAKELKMKPWELAERLLQGLTLNLQKGQTFIERIEIAGTGFINFRLSPEFFAERIQEILEKKEGFGKQDVGRGKKVIVEFSSPNIAKPFTIGHLRSTITGDAVAKTLYFLGFSV